MAEATKKETVEVTLKLTKEEAQDLYDLINNDYGRKDPATIYAIFDALAGVGFGG